MKRLVAAATKPAASIALLQPSLVPPVVELVDTALAFEKEKRWQTARLMQRATRAAYQAMVRGPGSSEGISTKPSWADGATTDAERRGGGLASVTLVSEQAGEDARSVDIRFEEAIPLVNPHRMKVSPEPTLVSGDAASADVVTDSMISDSAEIVTESMLVDSGVMKSTDPGGPVFEDSKKESK